MSSRSTVAHWLVHWPLVLEVPGRFPRHARINLVSKHASLRVICRDDMNTVHLPLDKDSYNTGGPSPPVQVKNPTWVIGYL